MRGQTGREHGQKTGRDPFSFRARQKLVSNNLHRMLLGLAVAVHMLFERVRWFEGDGSAGLDWNLDTSLRIASDPLVASRDVV